MTIYRSYSELISIESFEERFKYLALHQKVNEETFGWQRYLNQTLYKSKRWKDVRRAVMVRDNGFDLAHEDYPIVGNILIHHLNPITVEDILNNDELIFDLENLVSTSLNTHNAIHYGDIKLIQQRVFVARTENDTSPWRR